MQPAPRVEADEREENQGPLSRQKRQSSYSHPCRYYKTGGLSSAAANGRGCSKPMTQVHSTSSHRSTGGADSPATPGGHPGEVR